MMPRRSVELLLFLSRCWTAGCSSAISRVPHRSPCSKRPRLDENGGRRREGGSEHVPSSSTIPASGTTPVDLHGGPRSTGGRVTINGHRYVVENHVGFWSTSQEPERTSDGRVRNLAPRATRSSSSCANVSTLASAAPVPAASRASFEGYSSRMTSSVLPSVSSKVTVVTDPLSPAFLHWSRRCASAGSLQRPSRRTPWSRHRD